MPHKHTRRRQNDAANSNLPPSTIAKPLPVLDSKKAASKKKGSQQKQPDVDRKPKKKSKTGANGVPEDDTPRAFARLMRQQQSGGKLPSGLDDGISKKPVKKRKREDANIEDSTTAKTAKTAEQNTTSNTNIPKILPGERMSDFSARVNLAMPISGISKSRAQVPTEGPISKLREERQTKHERKLKRMQKEWRETEAKLKEKEEEDREEKEAEDADKLDLWKEWEVEAGVKKKKKGKKGKKKTKGSGDGEDVDDVEDDDDDDDPWAKINKKHTKPLNPLDVVQAPPEKLVKPKEKFKVKGVGGARVDVADVPAAAGSLKRREELASERKSIVEEYRRIMAEKRG